MQQQTFEPKSLATGPIDPFALHECGTHVNWLAGVTLPRLQASQLRLETTSFSSENVKYSACLTSQFLFCSSIVRFM